MGIIPAVALCREYCEKFNLTFVLAGERPMDDREEWGDDLCAGFDGDPAFGAMTIVVTGEGKIKVVTAYADGRSHMEDELKVFTPDAVERAIDAIVPLHPVEETVRRFGA